MRTSKLLGYDEVRTDFCYRSKKSSELHFGLGRTSAVDIRLETPDGHTRLYRGLPAGGKYLLSKHNAVRLDFPEK